MQTEWEALLAAAGFLDDGPNIPGNLLPERWVLGLVRYILCHPRLLSHGYVKSVYLQNLQMLLFEEGTIQDAIAPFNHALAALMSTRRTTRDYFVDLFGLQGNYTVFLEALKLADEPLSAEGDFDGDGTSNLDELLTVMSHDGSIENFAHAATDPSYQGQPLSASGVGARGGLFATVLALALWRLRRTAPPARHA